MAYKVCSKKDIHINQSSEVKSHCVSVSTHGPVATGIHDENNLNIAVIAEAIKAGRNLG